jgi:polyisoprenoid-binding protein YceI
MKKKLIITFIILISVLSILFLFRNMFFNQAKSDLQKSYINNPSNDISLLKGLELKSEISDEIKHSEIAFAIDGLIDTKGFFKQFEVLFKVSEKDPKEAKFKVKIDVSSIYTNEKKRDKSLISEEYFNSEIYPHIVFRSKSINKTSDGYKANGSLEMMGTKKDFSFPFNFLGTSTNLENINVAIFEGEFEIDRTQFGMVENTGIGNVVYVNFHTEMMIED